VPTPSSVTALEQARTLVFQPAANRASQPGGKTTIYPTHCPLSLSAIVCLSDTVLSLSFSNCLFIRYCPLSLSPILYRSCIGGQSLILGPTPPPLSTIMSVLLAFANNAYNRSSSASCFYSTFDPCPSFSLFHLAFIVTFIQQCVAREDNCVLFGTEVFTLFLQHLSIILCIC